MSKQKMVDKKQSLEVVKQKWNELEKFKDQEVERLKKQSQIRGGKPIDKTKNSY